MTVEFPTKLMTGGKTGPGLGEADGRGEEEGRHGDGGVDVGEYADGR